MEGDIGGQRRFSHGGAAGKNDEIGGVKAAEKLVEILEPGGHACQLAFALEGRLGFANGGLKGMIESLEPAFVLAGGCKVEKTLFCAFDQVRGRHLQIVDIGVVDHVITKGNELPAQGKVVDNTAVFGCVENRYRLLGETRQIAAAADISQGAILFEEIL